MNLKYLIPIVIIVGLAFILVILPAKKTYDETEPADLLSLVNSPYRFLTPDAIAERIIAKDPSILLIDVRKPDEYTEFTLPGAVNIPLESLMNPEQLEVLTQEGIDFVFFSDGSIRADQAWILAMRKGLKNIYVLKGGMNEWFACFFLTPVPGEAAAADEFDLYQFRQGVRQYFTGSKIVPEKQSPVESVNLAPRTKKSAAEGGC